ncbi:hypothetical protein ACNOYE_30615 [Nannocystaceae bacterium ST9]
MQGFNPYQPPAHADQPPPVFAGVPGEPLDWSIETALSVGWDRVKHWWPVLVLGPVFVNVLSGAISYFMQKAGLQGIDALVSMILGVFFWVGMVRMFTSAVRCEPPSFGQIMSGADRTLPLLGTQILMILAIMAGTIALVIPGIVLALGFSLAPYLCVDQQLGPIESLKRSWELMQGCKLRMLGFGFIAMIVMIAGVLALFVGVFVASAVVYAAFTWIYLRRRGELVPERVDDRVGLY